MCYDLLHTAHAVVVLWLPTSYSMYCILHSPTTIFLYRREEGVDRTDLEDVPVLPIPVPDNPAAAAAASRRSFNNCLATLVAPAPPVLLPLPLPVLDGVSLPSEDADPVPVPVPVCRFACPNSVLRHRDAKLSEQTVSPRLYTAGEMLTKVRTFELPPNESYSK